MTEQGEQDRQSRRKSSQEPSCVVTVLNDSKANVGIKGNCKFWWKDPGHGTRPSHCDDQGLPQYPYVPPGGKLEFHCPRADIKVEQVTVTISAEVAGQAPARTYSYTLIDEHGIRTAYWPFCEKPASGITILCDPVDWHRAQD
jgi:hypothetical protein